MCWVTNIYDYVHDKQAPLLSSLDMIIFYSAMLTFGHLLSF